MHKRMLGAAVVLASAVAGCGSGSVAADELAAVVERDGIPFAAESIPVEVTDFLAPHRVVVIGETHLIREHHDFVPALIAELHARGFRQLLLEWPHGADWVLADYAAGGDLVPAWRPPESLYGQLITGVRDLNLSLPEDQQIAVRGIDVNLEDYGGASIVRESLPDIARLAGDPEPLDEFVAAPYSNPEEQAAALDALRVDLESDRGTLTRVWGTDWYEVVFEMVDVELVSIRVRALREDGYDESVRMREDEMKRLADLRIAEHDTGSVVNVGGNHAQLQRLKGTSQEWLGDYLAHESQVAGGSVVSLVFVAAEIVADFETETSDYRVADVSPQNELFRLMNEAWPDQIVFLPFDDAVFSDGGVPMNFENTIYGAAPKRHYDAAFLYPLAHRIPLP